MRLDGAQTKSGEPRVFPFRLAPELKTLLETQWAARDGWFVFHDGGQPIGEGKLRCRWIRATQRAGPVGRLVHDLRRSAARDMRRAGLAESDIMALCGWETQAMFKRYCIRDEAALERAAGKRFNGTGAAQTAPAEPSSTSLSSSAAYPGQVAQLVEQRTENPRVGSSILPLATCSPRNAEPPLYPATDRIRRRCFRRDVLRAGG